MSEERPSDVFAACSADFAARFEPDGWKYARSGPHLTKRSASGRFTLRIDLGTGAYNVAGEYVKLVVYAGVRSREFGRWSEAHGAVQRSKIGVVAGAQLGNLGTPMRWVEWNLADPKGRADAIGEAAELIDTLAVPFWAIFEDEARLVGSLSRGEVPIVGAPDALDLLVWLGARAEAERYVRSLLERDPDLETWVKFELRARRNNPDFPDQPGRASDDIARAILAHGLAVS